MFQGDKWPFIPTCLSEIIDSETLTVIEAGCSARLGRALTILDYSSEVQDFGYRIESINLEQHGRPAIDGVLGRLLPDVAYALNAKQAFVARVYEAPGVVDRCLEVTAAYPTAHICGDSVWYVRGCWRG